MTDLFDLVGLGQRSSTFRFELLNSGLESIGNLEVEGYGARVENNINRKIKRTLSNLSLPPTDANSVNTLTDRVRTWYVDQTGVEWPLGVFLFADISQVPLTLTSSIIEGSMTDQGLIVDQPTSRTYSFNPGTSISTAIESMLQGLVPQFEVDISNASIRGSEAMVWPAGTSRLDIVNDLAAVGGMYSLYFDNSGVARVKKVPDLASVEATLRYGSQVGEQKVYTGSIVLTDDLLSAPNRYVVTSNGMNNDTIAGFWDIPASAPNSKENRGFIVASVTDQQGLESSAAAEAAAMAIGQADYSTYSWATFDAALNPLHDTFDIVSWEGVNYREQSWSMDLIEGGNHKHELRRIYNEPTFVTS